MNDWPYSVCPPEPADRRVYGMAVQLVAEQVWARMLARRYPEPVRLSDAEPVPVAQQAAQKALPLLERLSRWAHRKGSEETK